MVKKTIFSLGFILFIVTIVTIYQYSKEKNLKEITEITTATNPPAIVNHNPINQTISPTPQVTKISDVPSITSTTQYYQIVGETAQELRQQMNELGPHNYDGYTEWYIRWNYNYAQQNNQCEITSATVNTTITITLPFWALASNTNSELKQKWTNFITNLTRHENQHQNHGISASREILELLNNFPASPSCGQLERSANEASHQIIKKYNQKDLLYDQVTNHGFNEGVVFP